MNELQRKRLFRKFYLLPSAPLSIVKVVYKHLISTHHPDHDGDIETAVKYTTTYQEIKKLFNQ